jgi:hypothetical protein
MQAIARLRGTDPRLDDKTIAAMIAFLDMHLDRGRYADQMDIRTPAVMTKTDGTIEDVEFNFADRLLLSVDERGYPLEDARSRLPGVSGYPW